MNKENAKNTRPQNLTLAQYVHLRNGVPLGDTKSLQNMLYCSLGAASFAAFWQYWNPIWGYGLDKYVHAPLRRILPSSAVFIMTFIISGGIHDLATTAVSRSFAFLFTPWFFLLGSARCWDEPLAWICQLVRGGYAPVSILLISLFVRHLRCWQNKRSFFCDRKIISYSIDS